MRCTPCQKRRIESVISTLRKKNLDAQRKRVRGIIAAARQLDAITYERHKDDGRLYVKTFLISDRRNRNGWRASWNSIKKHHKSFIGKPGIEYMKCGDTGCSLDHTAGPSYEESEHMQERYRVSTIVDTVLDESNHTAYAIHRIESDDFADKILRNEIRYLSPSIWPDRERTTMQLTDNDEWHIDTTGWRGLHDAWVHSPAYGHDARVIDKCAGESASCITELRNSLS